jgi:hypothetical protein
LAHFWEEISAPRWVKRTAQELFQSGEDLSLSEDLWGLFFTRLHEAV